MIGYDPVTERYTIDDLTESEMMFFKLTLTVELERAYDLQLNSRCPPYRTLPDLEELERKLQHRT